MTTTNGVNTSRSQARPTARPGGRRTSRSIRRVLWSRRRNARPAAIHLGLPSPAGSSGLPADSGGQPSSVCAGHPFRRGPLGLAPGGVYRATPVTRDAGGLLLHRFTLTAAARAVAAVSSLWHFPAGRPGLPLATTLPCGARTFLGGAPGSAPTRPPDLLVRRSCQDTTRWTLSTRQHSSSPGWLPE